MAEAQLLDRQLLERLERLTLFWQKSLPGLVGGHNTSRFAGAGQEFLDHRQFHQGDDVRSVNWRAFLRLEKLFLKMFQLEPRIPVRLLVDISKSMAATDEKFRYARQLAAALCYVGLVRLDSICIQPFSDKLHDAFSVSGGRQKFQPAMNFLGGLAPMGPTRFFEVARQFLSKYPQRGLVMVISDFLDDQDCEKPLQYLSDFGHELILLQVWTPEDREPPWEGELDLEDAETGQHANLSFDAAARQQYTESFDEYASRLRTLALRNNGRYLGISSDVPVEEAIFGPMVGKGILQ